MNHEKRVIKFWNRVDKGPSCWAWRGDKNPGGYGLIYVNGRRMPAHRFSYELTGRKIPPGLHIDHLCRNPNCVNPDHLEPVTIRENLMRGKTLAAENKAKTHCIKGHPFSEENTRLIRYQGRIERRCAICIAVKNARNYDRIRAMK